MNHKFNDYDEAQVKALAQGLAACLKVADCILLSGDLGAGKTFFSKHIIQALCGEDIAVSSPTFAISQSYTSLKKEPIWHYDLYRLEYVAEIEETGLMDALDDAITLIEWPEIAMSVLPEDSLHISFAFGGNAHYRNITFSGTDSWIQRLSHLY